MAFSTPTSSATQNAIIAGYKAAANRAPSSKTKELWQTYRQELRNITSQTNPFSIVWPVKP